MSGYSKLNFKDIRNLLNQLGSEYLDENPNATFNLRECGFSLRFRSWIDNKFGIFVCGKLDTDDWFMVIRNDELVALKLRSGAK